MDVHPFFCPHCGAWLFQEAHGLLGRCPDCKAWVWPPRYARPVPEPPAPLHVAARPRLGRLWAADGLLWAPAKGHLLNLNPVEAEGPWQAFPLPQGVREVQGVASLPRVGHLVPVVWRGSGPLLFLTARGAFRPVGPMEAPAWSAAVVQEGRAWVMDGLGRVLALEGGRVLWQQDLVAYFPQARQVGRWLEINPELLGLADRLLLVRLPEGWAGLDANTGEPLWAVVREGQAGTIRGIPVIPGPDWSGDDGSLLPPAWSSETGRVYLTLGPHLLALDVTTRQVKTLFSVPRRSQMWGWFYGHLVPVGPDVLVLHNTDAAGGHSLSRITPKGEVRWTYPIQRWHPYLPPRLLGPWVLLPHRKDKRLVVLDADSGQERASIPLSGRPLSSPVWAGDRLWLLVHDPARGAPTLQAFEAVLRAEDVTDVDPDQWARTDQLAAAAQVWLVQGRWIRAVLALEDLGRRDEAAHVWTLVRRHWPRLAGALYARNWAKAWDLALRTLGSEARSDVLLEVFRRWVRDDPERALAALKSALIPEDVLPTDLSWRRRVLHMLQGLLLASWETLRPRLMRMPVVDVILQPSSSNPLQPKTLSVFQVVVRNQGYGLARNLQLRLQGRGVDVQPTEFTVEKLFPGEERPLRSRLLELRPWQAGWIRLTIRGEMQDEWGNRIQIQPQEQVLEVRAERSPRPIQVKFFTLVNVDLGFEFQPTASFGIDF